MADHNDPNAVNSIFSDIDVSAADLYDIFGFPSADTAGGDKVVIAKDTLVKATITQAKKAGMMGKGGSLGIRVDSTTTVDGQTLKLRSSKGKEGDDKTGTTVALVVLFGPLGFLKHGKNATIKAGTPINVYSDENKEVAAK